MGRKKNITKLSEAYQVREFIDTPFLDWQIARIGHFLNIGLLAVVSFYFMGNLNMLDKFCTFMISGKLVGTDYALTFSNVCWISAGIVAIILAKSVYGYFRLAKNRNKIKLQIKDASPLALSVRITA